MAIIVDSNCKTKLAWLLNCQGAIRYHNYNWSSVSKFLDIMRYHGIEEAKFYELYCALGSEKQQQVIDTYQLKPNPNWTSQRDTLAKEALIAKFETNFTARSALVSTGEES